MSNCSIAKFHTTYSALVILLRSTNHAFSTRSTSDDTGQSSPLAVRAQPRSRPAVALIGSSGKQIDPGCL